jgi:hypothetical protein
MKNIFRNAKPQEPIAEYMGRTDVPTLEKKASKITKKILTVIAFVSLFLIHHEVNATVGGSLVVIGNDLYAYADSNAITSTTVFTLSYDTVVSFKGCGLDTCVYSLSGVSAGTYWAHSTTSRGGFSDTIQVK